MGADLWLKCPLCDGDVRVDELNDIDLYVTGEYYSHVHIECEKCGVVFKHE